MGCGASKVSPASRPSTPPLPQDHNAPVVAVTPVQPAGNKAKSAPAQPAQAWAADAPPAAKAAETDSKRPPSGGSSRPRSPATPPTATTTSNATGNDDEFPEVRDSTPPNVVPDDTEPPQAQPPEAAAAESAAEPAEPPPQEKQEEPAPQPQPEPEPEVPVAPLIPDDGDPKAAAGLGVSLAGLRALRAALEAEYGKERLATMSTAEVAESFLKPATAERHCRYVDLGAEGGGAVQPGHVAPPTHFASHAWANRFMLLLDRVEGHLVGAAGTEGAERASVWLDVLCANLHRNTQQCANDIEAFPDVMKACTGGTIVVLDVANCNPATRAWCLLEWAATLAAHGPEALHLVGGLRPADRGVVVGALDVRRAECSVGADKAMILRAVTAQWGSPDAFNTALRMQLMLEPLSYSVDIGRLNARSTGTNWTFGIVQHWINGGAGGSGNSSRVLCMVAGSGEGKSTVSAALAEGLLANAGEGAAAGAGAGGGPLMVTAHHFVRADDARRLDVIATMKTLAFQLASRLPTVRERLLRLDAGRVAALSHPREAFTLLLGEPLRAYQEELAKARQQAQIVILLDALDEADPPTPTTDPTASSTANAQRNRLVGASLDGGANARAPADGGKAAGGGSGGGVPVACGNGALALLTRQLSRLPAGLVRFFVTTTQEAAGGKVLSCLARTFQAQGGVTTVRPNQLRQAGEAQAVITTMVEAVDGNWSPSAARANKPKVARPGQAVLDPAAAAAAVAASSGGGMMVYHTVSVACLPNLDHKASALLHPTLEDVYKVYGKVFGANWRGRAAVSDALAAAVAAREPLPLDLLQQMGLADAVAQLPGYPTLFYVEQGHVFTLHKSLLDWLQADPSCTPGRSKSASANTFAAAFTDNLAQRGHLLLGGHMARARKAAPGAAPSRYCVRYMLHHLAAAAAGPAGSSPDGAAATAAQQMSGEAAALLDEALADFGLIQAVLEAGRGPALVSALSCLPSSAPGALWRDVLRWLRLAMQDLQKGLEAAAGPPGALLVSSALARAPLTSQLYDRAVAVAGAPWVVRMAVPAAPPASDWAPLVARLRPPEDHLRALAWSPDGRQLAVGGANWSIAVYDAASGACNGVLEGHTGWVDALAWSPDGSLLMSGGQDRKVAWWDAATGQALTLMQTQRGHVEAVAWGPDSRLCAAGGQYGEVTVFMEPPIATASSSEAPKQLPVTQLVLGGGRQNATVNALAFSPDCELLAAAMENQTVVLLKVGESVALEQLTCLTGHSGPVMDVAFSACSRFLLSCSGDRTLRLCEGQRNWQAVAVLEGGAFVGGCTFAPDGMQVASSGFDNSVRLYDVSSVVPPPPPPPPPPAPKKKKSRVKKPKEYSDDETEYATSDDESDDEPSAMQKKPPPPPVDPTPVTAVQIAPYKVLSDHSDPVSRVSWAAANGLLASVSTDGTACVYDMGSSRRRQEQLDAAAAASAAALVGGDAAAAAAAGEYLHGLAAEAAAGGSGGGESKYDKVPRGDGRCGGGAGHGGGVLAAALNPDGRWLLTGGEDGTARITDRRTWQRLATLQGGGPLACARWSPDGIYAAASCPELEKLYVYGRDAGGGGGDTVGWRVVKELAGGRFTFWPTGPVGKDVLLAAAHQDGQAVRLYRMGGGWDEAGALEGIQGQVAAMVAGPAAGVAGACTLACVTTHGTVYLYDGESRSLTGSVFAGPRPGNSSATVGSTTVNALAWIPEYGTRPRLLAVACEDGAVHVVDPGSRSYVASLQFAAVGMLSVAASPSGRWLAAGGRDGAVRFSRIPDRVTAVDGEAAAGRWAVAGAVAGHSGGVSELVFAEDSTAVYSVGLDGVLLVCAPHNQVGSLA